MGLNLAIDHGNTAVKGALYDGDTLVAWASWPVMGDDELSSLLQGRKPDAVIYASVARHETVELARLRELSPRVVMVSPALSLPIVIDYIHSSQLGVDRVAGAMGAWRLLPGHDILIVDAGTAVTYDVMDSGGHFRGGNIAPGIKMRLDALHRYTAALPQLDVPDYIDVTTPFGNDTASAIVKGAVYGIAGAIKGYLDYLPDDTRVVITGGSGRLLSQVLGDSVIVDEHLVTNGLNYILQYNINK